ncbi:hypothetical protein [Streptomyces beihaiensis]|uniref:Uncharacterized protein n=1 Tax=Streptomyces beihaiensis TaxID=2984495 RepID=A0ABT3TRQ5_9ACTN|nr:hypothetical protein [Streptomyces beihaiensis]MCX3058708.1 hypothetical protein [Streptomyces beihaiensis]
MQTNSSNRRIRVGWAALALVLALGIVALVLYGTGTFDSWRDDRSLDQACDGALAQGGLKAALGTTSLRADSDESRGSLADCYVKTAESGSGRALRVTLRWSSDAPPSGSLAWYDDNYNGVKGQAAPLGNGWPGVLRHNGTWQSMVTLDCTNEKNKALVAYGDLYGASSSTALTGLGRVTTETAEKAAEKYGCHAKAGSRLTQVSVSQLGKPGSAKSLKAAQGSCAALRDLASTAVRNGVPDALEYPADAHTPQVNCYLTTPEKKPGYGLFAYYGAFAKDFLASQGDQLKKGFGPSHEDKDYAWATAQCPQSAQRAVFVLYHLYDRDTDTFPISHYSARFGNTALKAFAELEAKTRGCSDVRMAS